MRLIRSPAGRPSVGCCGVSRVIKITQVSPKPAEVSVHIIDCENPQLCFLPNNGVTFRCFYVVTKHDLADMRILVCEQPDRTAHIMKLPESAMAIGEVKSGLTSEAVTALWGSLLNKAFAHLASHKLPNEQVPAAYVTAAYVMDDEGDPEWTDAVLKQGFTYEGDVHYFRRSVANQLTGRRQGKVRNEPKRNAAFEVCQPDGGLNGMAKDSTAAVIQLLENTIHTSDDCLLRTKLQAADVLALFACNPNELQILLAAGSNGLSGILVADASSGPNEGHIEYLGVHSECRRQAVATMLMEEFQSLIADSALSVAVHDRNLASVSFFLRHNFVRSEQYQLWTRDI